LSERAPDESHRKLIDDLTMLIESSSVLAGSLKLETVLPRTLDLCRSLITADSYAVWLFSAETSTWSIVSSSGLSDEYRRMVHVTLDHSAPVLDQPMVIEDADTAKALEKHRDLQRREGIQSLLVIPLRISGKASGTVVFYYKKRHRFSDAEVRIGTGIGNLVGASLTSIRNVENEAALRRLAEKARKRAAFLAQLSTVLSQTLDLPTALEKLVRLSITAIQQICTIYFRDENGNFVTVANAHVDASKEQLQREFARSYQPATNPDSTIKRVFETQEPVLLAELTPRQASVPDARGNELLRALDPRSVIMAPLIARGKSIGVIVFSTSDPVQRYNEEDLEFAKDIARQAAWLIDNARLYSEVLEAGQRKDQFLAMLGHELRNPLAPVLTGVEILGDPDAPGPVREEATHIIRRQATHMSRIVDDLLDVSRIRSGRMEFKMEPVDLSGVVEACARDHRQLFDKLNIRFSYEIGGRTLWANADTVRLSQAIGNLLNNASKFTPEGGAVRLSLSQDADSRAIISVQDSGAGIPAGMIPRLFEVFAQGDVSIDRNKGGLGLGLVLVKGLIEAHGGSVAVSCHAAAAGSGAEFIIKLPLIAPVKPGASAARTTQHHRAWRILIIEDHADVAKTMSVLLTLAGHTVSVARTGIEGLEKVQEFNPQVVLCDIGLPGGMDGLSVARALRKNGSSMTLIALSGYGTEVDQQQSLNAGFDLHLTKPVELKTLESILNHTVAQTASIL
jgi:signal transduction histidine kinase/CheY-like chemotaxis protein